MLVRAALAIKNRANAFFWQVARIPNLASRQYRPRNHGRHLISSERACIAMEPTGAKGLASLFIIALLPQKIASPAACMLDSQTPFGPD
jgi:hypothetical protein